MSVSIKYACCLTLSILMLTIWLNVQTDQVAFPKREEWKVVEARHI